MKVRRRRLTFTPMKSTLKITSKGQVTLRKKMMDELGVQPGDKITVEVVEPGRAELKPAKLEGALDKFIGCLHEPRMRALSIDEMNTLIAKGWAGELDEPDDA
ncbi:AbrB/MazE/SpoVT family DNA-binding domain-containing protein [Methylocystis iwaonis]|nr:AbrB/MazE/SpoVT family DNA-binding domain-containing protein [Methylocystis iwaonis]